jgi:aspartate-semialdehyde dehydrogenase
LSLAFDHRDRRSDAGQYPMPLHVTVKTMSARSAKTCPATWPGVLGVSDNLRKGAATNAVQIAELLVGSRAGVSL